MRTKEDILKDIEKCTNKTENCTKEAEDYTEDAEYYTNRIKALEQELKEQGE